MELFYAIYIRISNTIDTLRINIMQYVVELFGDRIDHFNPGYVY